MKRVCKEGGTLLLLERGASKISPLNEWLNFSAARDLTLYGLVESIDFDKFIDKQSGIKVIHRERKNLGMTYIYILEKQTKDQTNE